MKSKKVLEFINGHIEIGSLQFTAADIEYCVMLAEQEAEEEITRYKTALEESKQREELAQKIITDKRNEIEALKARAVEAFKLCCRYRSKSEDSNSCFLNDRYNVCDNNCSKVKLFIQKLNER